jgi:hypothetical protein
MLLAIPGHCAATVWKDVAPLLQKAIDKSQKDWSIDNILYHLQERNMQLWVWTEDYKIVAACVSQVIIYPNKKVCQLPFIAGKMMRNWLDCEQEVTKWAKEQGCTQLEGFCRDGWLRVLMPRNWFKCWITMRKDI